MPEWAFVALGSNLGNREAHLASGRSFLAASANTTVVEESSIEETIPLGPPDQGPYLNQMALLKTELSPRELLEVCRAGEQRAGRERADRWGPRTLDLDIVRFGECVVNEPDLVVPHPELARRGFWQRELAELLPKTLAPGSENGLPPWAQVEEHRRAHIRRVAGLVEAWAVSMGRPPAEGHRWVRAAYLHDALRDAPRDDLARWSGARWSTPSLYHGPAAAQVAEEHGETDSGVLDAVRFHSVGYAGWDDAGRMLYMADYLEPERSSEDEQRADLAARVPTDPVEVLRIVVRERLVWNLRSNLPVWMESSEFWNAVLQSG
jgi:2-amino-4-hydroxy-6-hydroxymethyldihydropteridine diphosphokinase